MSDPVKNVEVEDVLSSIRRLVSEDKRPAAAPAVTETAQDRLVLTPALRVMDDYPPASSDIPADTASDSAEEAAANVSEHDISDQREAVEPEITGLTDEGGDSDDDTGMSPEITEPSDATETADETSQTPEADPVAATDNDAGHSDAGDTFLPNHDEDAEAGSQDTPFSVSDTDGQDMVSASTETAEPSELPSDTDDAATSDIVDAELMEPDAPLGHSAQAASLSSKIAALEAVIGGRDDQWEPDDTGDSDYSGTEAPSMTWDDPEPETLDATVAPDAEDLSETVDLLDEDTLREMVSDIVREELQGALGERITRNVRKLVRREIHRALAAQELE